MLRLVLIAVTLATSQLASADCARVGLTPKVLTPENAAISIGGGIVVGTVGLSDGKLDKGDTAVHPGWRFKGQSVTPVIKSIAPGLAIYQTVEEVELVDRLGTPLVKVKHANAKARTLPAPIVKAAKHSGKRGGYHTPERVTVELDKPLPAEVVAVVLLDAKTATPKSWWLVDASSRTIYGFVQLDCTPLPNGTVVSAVGDSIKVMYVDATGQVSAPSAAITIN